MSQSGIIDIGGSDPQVPTSFITDSGTAVPINNELEILGGTAIDTSGSGNTVTINFDITEVPTIATTYQADSGSATPALNIINFVGAPGISTSAAGNTVTIATTGGGAGIDSVNVDFATVPGTDPVIPDGTGLITMSGRQVPNLSVGAQVIRSHSLAANSLTYEIQQSGAVAATNSSYNGVAHFNSAQFTVDGNGFVSSLASATDLHTARYIVSAGGTTDGANYTTLATALTAAIAAGGNQTIFLQPGSYTGNHTIPANINLAAYNCDALTPNVTIIGTITCTDAGSRTFSGIRFQTNAAVILSITGTAATVVNFVNCYLNCTNSDFITSTTTSASSLINIYSCQGDLGTTGIKYFAISNGGVLIWNSQFFNSGASVTASTLANASSVSIINSRFSSIITSSNTSSVAGVCTDFFGTGNSTFTIGGTGTNEFSLCRFETGTSSSISISAGVTCEVQNCVLDSSNTNVITGAGTLEYGNLTFAGSSNVMNTTTQVGQVARPGITRSSHQPAFLATVAAAANQTGDNTIYTLTTGSEIFDQNGDFAANTFTAPYTGRYFIACNVEVGGLTSAMTVGQLSIVTSNRSYGQTMSPAKIFDNNTNATFNISMLCDMDAADTCTFTYAAFNGTKVADINGGFMSAYLVC